MNCSVYPITCGLQRALIMALVSIACCLSEVSGQGYFKTIDLGANEQAIQDMNLAGVTDHVTIGVQRSEGFFSDEVPCSLHLYKLDSNGEIVDQFEIDNGEFTYPSMMAQRGDGYDLITSFNAFEELRWGVETRRLDSDFNLISQQRLYLPESVERFYGDSPLITHSGDYVVGGHLGESSGGPILEKLCAWRFDDDLTDLGFISIDSPSLPVIRSLDMVELSDGGFASLVFNWQLHPDSTFASTTKLARYTEEFEVVDVNGDRSVMYPTGNLGPFGSIEPYADTLLLALTDLRGVGTVRDAQLSIIDTDYTVLDSIVLGTMYQGEDKADKVLPRSLCIRENGNILAVDIWNFAALQAPQAFGPHPTWIQIYELDPQLTILYRRFFGGDRNYRLTDVLAAPDGGAIITGMYWDFVAKPGAVDLDAFILKVDAEGNYTSLDEHGPEMIDLRLGPNPATDHFDISTSLLDFELIFRDLNGRELHRERVIGGQLSVDISSWPSGIYLYTIRSANETFELTERLLID